jgi:CRP/FNR family transcriptional regulator
MAGKRDFLKSLQIFSTLPESDLDKLSNAAEELTYKNGEYIFYEGDPPEWLCIIREGNVKAVKYLEDGKEIILHVFMPGDIFGELAILDRRPYPASAQSMGQARILKLHYNQCKDLCERVPEIRMKLIQSMGEKQRGFVTQLEAALTTGVERRIANTLMKLASIGDSKGGTNINLHLTRKDIANMVGTTIETAIRVMSRFQKEGIVEGTKDGITILRPDLLREKGGEHD